VQRVIIESPLNPKQGLKDWDLNVAYSRLCMKDSLLRGEAPFASHLLYTQVLDDFVPGEREMGMKAGFAWRGGSQVTAVYTDLGVSSGMEQGIESAYEFGHDVVYRKLPADVFEAFLREVGKEGWTPEERTP